MPLNIPLSVQEIAIALAVGAAALVLWRIARKPGHRRCSQCPANPDTASRSSHRPT